MRFAITSKRISVQNFQAIPSFRLRKTCCNIKYDAYDVLRGIYYVKVNPFPEISTWFAYHIRPNRLAFSGSFQGMLNNSDR